MEPRSPQPKVIRPAPDEGRTRTILVGGFEFEPEAGALAGLGFEADLAAHALDTLANKGQADAGAGIGFLGMEPLKQAEDFLMMLRCNANTVVGYPNPDGPI